MNSILKALHVGHAPPPLPESFLFGVGTADHQCEAYDPAREDIRDQWERQCGLTMRGRATDFENRCLEDIELARRIGCGAFRFSISWSRVEPEPGKFDDAAFEHYRRMVAAIRLAGMEPIVTLHHFTWPIHIEARGGMTDERFPHWFELYAAQTALRLGDDVRIWITFNEPNQLVFGYLKLPWDSQCYAPPGWPEDATIDEQISKVGKLIRNLFMAHSQARHTIARCSTAALVGANPLVWGLPGWIQHRILDRNATQVRSYEDLGKQVRRYSLGPHPMQGGEAAGASGPRAQADHAGRQTAKSQPDASLLDSVRDFYHASLDWIPILSTMFTSNWWHLGMAGELQPILCPPECVGQQDFVGLDYYWGTPNLLRIPDMIIAGSSGRFDRAPVDPSFLYDTLRDHARMFPGKPLLVVENGSVPVASGVDRITYIRDHVREVQKAVGLGIDIMGYICRSITSNREWGHPFSASTDFGLYHIALDTDARLRRHRTGAAEAYQKIIAERGVY